MVGLCSAKKSFVFETIKKTEPIVFGGSQQVKEPKSSPLCIVCEFAMTEIDRLIGTKATEVFSYVFYVRMKMISYYREMSYQCNQNRFATKDL